MLPGILVLIVLLGGRVSESAAQPFDTRPGRTDASMTPRLVAEPFEIQQVRLLDGPFKEAMERDARYLMELEPDRLLHRFRSLAGLEPKGKLYGGWESQQISGHSLGHYLSALSMYYAESRDERFKERVAYIVSELAKAQEARGNGYVGAIPGQDTLWTEIRQGQVEGEPFNLNGVWVPWYTLHKLFAGLIDAYSYTDNQQALQVVTALADWAYETTEGLSDAQWQEMLDTEHGGMNEALANLYALTGEQRYLDLSLKFHHGDVLSPIARRTPQLEGLHANTQIPKVVGAVRQYELTGLDSLRTIADVFWDRVVYHHSYHIGGNSAGEHFGPPDSLASRLGVGTAETCNTYNMLKLSRHLFGLTGEARYADYHERALYNHILASQEPKRGMMTYYMSLKPGHFKTYSSPDSSFWCCVGSGMENHVRYGQGVYFHKNDALYVNLFIPSELTWKEKGITLRQETRFPEDGTTRLTFDMEEAKKVNLRIRHPEWAKSPPEVRINGRDVVSNSEPGSYFTLRRTWHPGDEIEVTFPMRLHTETLAGGPQRTAVLYGPIVLAGVLGTEKLPEGGAYAGSDQWAYKDAPEIDVPRLEAAPERVSKWLEPVEGEPLTFRTKGVGEPEEVTFRPFY